MKHNAKSIRAFIGAKNFTISRNFYQDLGFQEHCLADNMSYFETGGLGFYLQDYYAKDWVDNTMVFLEVSDVQKHWEDLLALDLSAKYAGVRLVPIKEYEWGRECFLHDPSGILWHFGEFYQ